MARPPALSSAARVYRRIVPLPVRSVAANRVTPRVRRKVKRSLVRTLDRREARLHRRALRRIRRSDFRGVSERRIKAPDGRIAHVHSGLTPDLARRLDHDLIAHALDRAEIPWFAVPALDDRRICFAVEQQDKAQLRRVLRALLEEHTGYVVSASPANNETRTVPGSHMKAWKHYGKAKVIRITWLRTDPTQNLWVGDDQGVEIEFWTVNNALPVERLVGPRPNRVQRVVPRDAPGVEIGIERLSGYSDIDGDMDPTVTLENFDIPRLEEITFPVDAVIPWRHDTPWGEELLRAALRSLHQYAPWVDVVHILEQAPAPHWLRSADHLSVIQAGPDAEMWLHQLPDLSDRFLLMRPGALFGRPVRPFDYFSPHGGTRPRRGPWTAEESFAPWTATAHAATGRAAGHGYAPGPQPCTRSALVGLAASGYAPEQAPDAQLVPVLPLTHPADGLTHHFARTAGLAEPAGEATVALHAAFPGIRRHLDRLLVRRDIQQMQLSGLGAEVSLSRGGTDAVISFLHRYFPVPSPFELDPGPSEDPDKRT